MSGIEVAGLVLAVVPVLFKALDSSKTGWSLAEAGFAKRKTVERLARALLEQAVSLKELLRLLLRRSGCEDVNEIIDDPWRLFRTQKTKMENLLREHLGEEVFLVMLGSMNAAKESLEGTSRCIAGLVHEANPTDNLEQIIHINETTSRSKLDLMKRIRIVVGAKQLKEAIKDLNTANASLDRLYRLVQDNHAAENTPDRKSLRLASLLHKTRRNSNALSTALWNSWTNGCHPIHQAKLLLDDRVRETIGRRQNANKVTDARVSFELLFKVSESSSVTSWYEAAFQILPDDGTVNDKMEVRAGKVKINAPPVLNVLPKKLLPVTDLCQKLQSVCQLKKAYQFYITGKQTIEACAGVDLAPLLYRCGNEFTLRSLLSSTPNSIHQRVKLSLKDRMILALHLASSWLQLVRTQWLDNGWSDDNIYFLPKKEQQHLQNKQTPGMVASQRLDLSRPFILLEVDHNNTVPPGSRQADAKDTLLELGIMLLELWHETTLEDHFGLVQSPEGYWQRLKYAGEWADDQTNPPLPLYDKAIGHCVRGIIGSHHRLPDCDTMELFRCFCADIIEPLYQNCKPWT